NKEYFKFRDQNVHTAKICYNPHSQNDRLHFNGMGLEFNIFKKPYWMNQTSTANNNLSKIYYDFFMHLTGNDSKSFEYMLKWLANSIQDRNRTILVAIGDQGIGKGVLGQILEKIHGKDNFALTSDVILKDKFNSPIVNKRLVHIDEINISKNT